MTCSADKTIRISHAESGSLLTLLDHYDATVLDFAVDPRCERGLLLAGLMDGFVSLFDLAKDSVVFSSREHVKYVSQVCFSADGEYFMTGSHDKTANLYRIISALDAQESDVKGTSPITVTKIHSLSLRGVVETIACDPSHPHRFLIGTRDDHLLHILEPLPSPKEDLYCRHETINLNSNGDDWVSFTPMKIQVLEGGLYFLCFTDMSSGKVILYALPPSTPSPLSDHSSDTTATKRVLRHVRTYYGPIVDTYSTPRLVLSKDQRYFYTTSDDHSLWVFEIATGRVMTRLVGHEGVVRGIDVDKITGRVVSVGFDKSVRVWGCYEEIQDEQLEGRAVGGLVA